MQNFYVRKQSLLLAGKIGLGVALGALTVYLVVFAPLFAVHYNAAAADTSQSTSTASVVAEPVPVPILDKADYDLRLWALANNGTSTRALTAKNIWMGGAQATTTGTTTPTKKYPWPTKTPYPNAGALLPFHRIIAYYGNFYSKGMGVLGQYPQDVMLAKLADEVAKWNAADPTTPAMPAIDYIAVTAQGSPGADGKYRFRMPDSQIDHALELAHMVHGIVILDVQVGLSTLQSELPALEKYLKMPNVHLAIDPEFSIKSKDKPGDVIGTMNASDINYAANYLAHLVKDNNLPPKVLIVHRFTQNMVVGYKQITPLPEVQIVIDMDGWGGPSKKLGTYQAYVTLQPIQFSGFKLFYKNDLKPPSKRLLTPMELLKLTPKPVFIQFQ